ncbi:class I SAM-dependent methyltransferase [Streptomyces sp. NPDC059215]|uniref:class I SAM-dependent methyltransferase n=1 Tax=Streptomyces sp. NPDC059215 TaxID=3346772 RepID=UPI00367400C1
MTTEWWTSSTEATTYASLGNPLEWRVAYPALFEELAIGTRTHGPILDYGCGPGTVASYLAERYACDVVGCDISSDMIGLATRIAARPGVRFIDLADGLSEFPDEYFGAAICTFVLCVIGDREQHLSIVREIHRLLKDDAPFGIVVPHPDSTGVQFSTCRSGDSETLYAAGDPMTTRLTGNGNQLVIEDFYWPTEWYEKLLAECGFHSVRTASPHAGGGEPDSAPFLIVTGRR